MSRKNQNLLYGRHNGSVREANLIVLDARVSNELSTLDSRGVARRRLRLGISANPGQSSTVRILDLSQAGMTIETTTKLAVGQILVVDLPEAVSTEAYIDWQRGSSFGCKFAPPVSKAAISAAILQGSPRLHNQPVVRQIREYPLGSNLGVTEVEKWKSDFYENKLKTEYDLIGFRQDVNGVIFAIIAKACRI